MRRAWKYNWENVTIIPVSYQDTGDVWHCKCGIGVLWLEPFN